MTFRSKEKVKTSSWQANLEVRLVEAVADGAGRMNVAHIRTHHRPLEVVRPLMDARPSEVVHPLEEARPLEEVRPLYEAYQRPLGEAQPSEEAHPLEEARPLEVARP